MLSSLVTEMFSTLLSEKHLYQSVRIDIKSIFDFINAQTGFSPQHREQANLYLERYVTFPFISALEGRPPFLSPAEIRVVFTLPTVKTYCANCGSIEPHNPMSSFESDLKQYHSVVVSDNDRETKPWQAFNLMYVCQACKKATVVFLVERRDMKLTLSGRNPIEQVLVPHYIPKRFRSYLSEAVVASQTGAILCGLFLLRVFIEQYCISKCTETPLTCDIAINAYMETLPKEFREHFPSLREIYGVLSEAIHTANADPELFKKQCDQVYHHFDAKRVYKMPE